MIAVRIVIAFAGVALVVSTVRQAIQTFVVPRAVPLVLNRLVYTSIRRIFQGVVRLRGATDDRIRRHGIMASWAPLGVVALPGVWLVLALIGYAGALVGAAFLVNRLGPYVYLSQPLIGPELASRPTG